jgi:alpha-1,2-mannosyltransferase
VNSAVSKPASAPGTRLLIAGASAFAAVVLSWVVYDVLSGRGGGLIPVDLKVYRIGGLIVRHQAPYYDPHRYLPLYGWPGYGALHLKFTYTPFAAVVFAIISLVPMKPLVVLSVITNMAALVFALWCLFGGLGYAGRRRLGAALLAAAATFWLQPVIRTIYLGQINLLLMALILWDLCQPDSMQDGRVRWWKGFGTGIAAGIKLVPLIFVPYQLITRRFREAAMTVAGFLFTVLLGFAVLPHDSAKWWLHGLVIDDGTRAGFMGWAGNQSLRAIVSRLSGSVASGQHPWEFAAFFALIAGLTAAWFFERAGHHVVAILATALTGLLVSPISWDHHWVWISPAIATAAHYAVKARTAGLTARARWLWLLAAGMVITYAAWPDAIWENERYLSKLSLGFLWAQPNTNPLAYTQHGDQPWFVEYHWHGFQLVWGDAYILGGMALLLVLLGIAWRIRATTPLPEAPASESVPAHVEAG